MNHRRLRLFPLGVAQLEVRTLAEVRTALTLAGDLDRIMLDNMVKVDAATGAVDTSMLQAALALINGAPRFCHREHDRVARFGFGFGLW
jgi:hypothetical protein